MGKYWKFGDKYAGISKNGNRFLVDTRKEAIKKSNQNIPANKKQKSKKNKKVSKVSVVKKSKQIKKPKSKSKKQNKKQTNNKGGNKKMGLNMSKIFGIIRKGALVSPAISEAMKPIDPQMKVNNIVANYTGFNMAVGQFDLEALKKGWLPYLASKVTTEVLPSVFNSIKKAIKV